MDPSLNGLSDEFRKKFIVGGYVGRTSMYVVYTSLLCCTLSIHTEHATLTQQTWAFSFWASVFGLVVLGHIGPPGFYGWVVVNCWSFLGEGPRRDLGLIWKIGPYLGLRCLFWILGLWSSSWAKLEEG